MGLLLAVRNEKKLTTKTFIFLRMAKKGGKKRRQKRNTKGLKVKIGEMGGVRHKKTNGIFKKREGGKLGTNIQKEGGAVLMAAPGAECRPAQSEGSS